MSGYELDDCPDLAGWASEIHHPQRTNPADTAHALLGVITEGVEANPRSAQTELGPSEIGHPCNRWLAHRFAGTPERERPVMWRAAVGTAVDNHVKGWVHRWNDQHDTARYLADVLVYVGDLYPGRPIFGHLDVLDLWTATVIDVKTPGPTQMKAHKTACGGPERNDTYRRQKHLYARGVVNAGFPVAQVGILRVPSAGELADAIWTVEPYRPELAEQTLARAGGIARMVDALGPAAIPLQPTTDSYCRGCPFYDPAATDLTRSCPGDQAVIEKRETPPQYMSALIA